jgi:hypothetical protein
MPPPANRRKLRKREIVLAVTTGALAAGAAAGILSDGFGGPGSSFESQVDNAAFENAAYEVGAFEEITTVGPQDVVVTQGDTFSARAEGSTGALALLEVVVEDGKLVIRPKGEYRFGFDWDRLQPATIYVTVPTLEGVSLAGSGDIRIDKIEGEEFVGALAGPGTLSIAAMTVDEADFRIGGSGNVVAAGTAREARVSIGGSGEVRAGGLRTQTATISIGGSGDVALTAEDEVDVSIAGSGNVGISGPARCSVRQFGSGNVDCSGGGGTGGAAD